MSVALKLNSLFRVVMIAIPLSGACIAAASGSAVAAELRLPEGDYPYNIVEQDVKVVLREFGQNVGVRMQIGPKVQGMVRGKLPPLTAKAFLEHLCRVYGLDWYFDGHVLHITPADESGMRVVKLGQVKYDKLMNSMKESEFFDARFAITPTTDGKSITLAAPPGYVALIEQNIAALNAETAPPPVVVPRDKVTVYRGGEVSIFEVNSAANQVR
jgi:type III secretion protein C